MAAPITVGTDLVCGNFEQTRFCAASILSFSSSVGWGSESSSISVELVEDKCNTKKKYYFGGLNTVGGTANRDLLWGNVAQYTTGKDSFTKPAPGTPAYFQFAEFSFQGIIRDWEYKFATSGDTISVNVSSPSQLLNDSVVILDGYNGVNAVDLKGVPNLLPFFGWIENSNGVACLTPNHTATAFNEFAAGVGGIHYAPTTKIFGAIKNADGVQWDQVRNYLRLLDPAVCFGGYCYKVDFSALPGSPGYKLPGTHMTLMQIVEKVCEDHGYDFYCYLTDNGRTIAISTIDRKLAPITGIIEGYVAGNEHVVSSSYGREIRDELCNSFLVGDNAKVIWQMELGCTKANASDDNCGIWPYWGHINGNAIIGQVINNDHTFYVDARTWGIPGLEYYIMDVGEIRAALSSRDNWEDYFSAIINSKAAAQANWPPLKVNSVAQKTGLEALPKFIITSTFKWDQFVEAINAAPGAGVDPARLKEWSQYFLDRKNKKAVKPEEKLYADIVFENVQKMGNEYYGKKYMVRIPWQCYDMRGMVGRDDFRMDTNWELSEGGWTEAYDVIGLNRIADPFGFEKFRNDEGLTTASALFQPMDLHQIKGFTEENSWQNPVVNPNRSWVNASPATDEGDRGFVFKNVNLRTDPRAVMTLGFNPMLTKAAIGEHDIPNNNNLLKLFLELMGANDARARELLDEWKDTFDKMLSISVDIPGLPAAMTVPMRSTRITYGPWTNTNGFELGKTEFIKDTEVAPWNFGSVATMDLAARLKVDNRQSKQLLAERGNIQIAGAPIVNLAGFLGGPSGPYITGIDCAVGSSGVTTTFNLQTFTPKFGNLASGIINNIQRINQFNNISRKLMLANAIAAKKMAIKDQGGSSSSSGGGGSASKDNTAPGGGSAGGMGPTRSDEGTDDKSYVIKYIAGDVGRRPSGTLEVQPNSQTIQMPTGLSRGTAVFLNEPQYQTRLAMNNNSAYQNKWGVEVEGLWRGFTTGSNHDLLPSYTSGSATNDCKEKTDDGLSSICSGGYDGCDIEGDIEKPLNFSKPMIPPSYTAGGEGGGAAIPIICQTLDPYMLGTNSEGKLPGVDMEYAMHDGPSAPTDLNYMVRGNQGTSKNRSFDIEVDKYQDGDNIRAAALRGPLLVAGWGYDIDGFPVPNETPDNPSNKFKEHWLHKSQDWKVGPVDLRWDESRGVWSAAGAFKLVRVKLDSWVNPAATVKGELVDETNNNSAKKEICIYNNTDRPLRKGWIVIAWYDTTTCEYYVIEAYKPIYKVKSEECSLTPSKGKIVDAGGAPVGSQSSEVKFEGSTKQPLWDGQVVYTTAICVDDEGVETHRILQGEFRGYDTVVWVNCIPTSGSTGATGSTSSGASSTGCWPEDECQGYSVWVLLPEENLHGEPVTNGGTWQLCSECAECSGSCASHCIAPNPNDSRAVKHSEVDVNNDDDFAMLECLEGGSYCWDPSYYPALYTVTGGTRSAGPGLANVYKSKCFCNSNDTCDDTKYDSDDDEDCEDYELCIQVRKLWLQTPAGEKKKYQGDEMGEDCEPKEADATPDCGEGGSSGGGSSGSSSGSGS